jgi:hypothetical protein
VISVKRLCSTVLSDYSIECPFPTGLAALLVAIKKSLSGFTTTGELAVSIQDYIYISVYVSNTMYTMVSK